MMKNKWMAAIHPILFSVQPALRIYAVNIELVYFDNVLKLCAFLLGGTLFMLWGLKYIIPQLMNRAFIISIFLLLFFNFSPLSKSLQVIPGMSEGLSIIISLALFLSILLITFYSTLNNQVNLSTITQILNIISLTMLLMISFNIANNYRAYTNTAWRGVADEIINPSSSPKLAQPNQSSEESSFGASPDIYYIILDGYGRADVLQEFYRFDNQEFLNGLSERGFYVAEQSSSNYPQTYLSLSSSLNMSYLDKLSRVMGDSDVRAPLRYLIQNNRVAKMLREAGYQFIFISSGYGESATENNIQADVCYCEEYGLNGLETALLNLTPLTLNPPEDMNPYTSHRHKVLTTFRHLTELPTFEQPTFVFAHVMAPHPPFVFAPNGEEKVQNLEFTIHDGSYFPGSHEEYVTGYREQVLFLNTKLFEVVDSILKKSQNPPIIILQGDHGPGSMLDWESAERSNMKERLSIFAAYHLPDDAATLLPPDITPVNTFRLLFNAYFGADFELLENKIYFSEWESPYHFIPVKAEELQ